MNFNTGFSGRSTTLSRSPQAVAQEQGRFLVRVYNWMTSGLLLTGGIAYWASNTPAFMEMIFRNPLLFYGLILGELALVFTLAGRVMKMKVKTASLVFWGYSALNGLTFSIIFLMYTSSSIVSTFLVTAGTFGAMSFYGATTKKDLTSWGSFLIMGLVGIIIASLVNFFFHSSMIYWVVTYAGILIFVGLTAYDTQKILEMNILGNEGTDEDTKEAIRGALTLYLDFINLFLMLLRLLGNRR